MIKSNNYFYFFKISLFITISLLPIFIFKHHFFNFEDAVNFLLFHSSYRLYIEMNKYKKFVSQNILLLERIGLHNLSMFHYIVIKRYYN